MTPGEFIATLIRDAQQYRRDRAASLAGNGHLHQWPSVRLVNPTSLDAALVDFLNYVATQRGMDLAFHRDDFAPLEVSVDDDPLAGLGAEDLPTVPFGLIKPVSD